MLASLALKAQEAPTLLILGGTRFLGPAVVDSAVRQGYRVTVFHRGKTPKPAGMQGVEELLGDRDGTLEALRGRRWDAVVDTSGQQPAQVEKSAQMLASQANHYLFVSTISVYAAHGKPGLRENDHLVSGASDYGGKKARCEEIVRAAFGPRSTVVRPCVMAGPLDGSDRLAYWVQRMNQGGTVLAPGDGKDPVQLLDVRDAADFMVAALRLGGTFNLAGPAQPLSMAGLLAACGPAQPVWASPAFLEEHQVDLPLWADRHGDWRGFFQVDASRARAAGLRMRPLAQTIADTRADSTLKTGPSQAREAELLQLLASRP